jgi:hypothetical protein
VHRDSSVPCDEGPGLVEGSSTRRFIATGSQSIRCQPDPNRCLQIREIHRWTKATSTPWGNETRILPCAGNAEYGDSFLWCFHAIATALFCFLDVENTSSIFVDVLPAMLRFKQQDRKISNEGPLSSAVKAMVALVLEEEKTGKRTENLLQFVEKKRETISPASLRDVQVGRELDSALVSRFLLARCRLFKARKASISNKESPDLVHRRNARGDRLSC